MIRLSSLQVPKIGIVVLALSAVAPGATAQPAAPPSAETPAPPRKPDTALLEQTVERAKELPNLHSMIVSHDGSVVAEQVFRGPALDRPVNIKSASKTVLSALVGIAIDKGVLKGVDQTVASVLESSIPEDADDRVDEITVGHLLSMRSGLERTSGRNYGAWVSSGNWVRYALSRPMVDEPGGRMLYSTGNTHLLSAMLTRASKRSTLDLARDWLGDPLDINIAPWTRDPQGIYLGGNEMALSPRALLRFGEMYRLGGVIDGNRVLSEDWIRESWTPRTASPFTGDSYGYGWFMREVRGHPVHYAWGYGGQMLFVVPSLALTVVMTSDPTEPSRQDGHMQALHALLADGIVPAVEPPPQEGPATTGSTGGASVEVPAAQ
ncbi:serine hydrolase domain-containing protein [Microvirga sp. GCM10011540]|uniref:serine hydrolase domain-containing protein n=1 Tax=Microvirga sp. GCM10011540 TaxID=3317338 RepID=UPI003613F858